MDDFHIIGTGACGFLRLHYMLKSSGYRIKYKGGATKFQNSFETSDNNSLIWESDLLTSSDRLRRVSKHTSTNITHSYIRYVDDFIKINTNIKFLCFRGLRSHSIKSLATSWGYRNPCYVKDRTLGKGRNRYSVEQFPDYSDSADSFQATEKYWDAYYSLAESLQERYPDNFLIIESPRFFSEEKYQKESLQFANIEIPFFNSPIDFESWKISTSLHGGLGNNLFQIAEVLAFCEEHDLPEPVFGTWEGLEKYPRHYGADKFLGGHSGDVEGLKKCFDKLAWKSNLHANFDTKFVINDMFGFSSFSSQRDSLLNALSLSETFKQTVQRKYSEILKKRCVYVHIRTCTLPADDHVKRLPYEYYFDCFDRISENVNFLVFSDNNELAQPIVEFFSSETKKNFYLIEEDLFASLALMTMCQDYVLAVSTFGFWGAYLNENIENSRVFYHKSWLPAHGDRMIPFSNWEMLD